MIGMVSEDTDDVCDVGMDSKHEPKQMTNSREIGVVWHCHSRCPRHKQHCMQCWRWCRLGVFDAHKLHDLLDVAWHRYVDCSILVISIDVISQKGGEITKVLACKNRLNVFMNLV